MMDYLQSTQYLMLDILYERTECTDAQLGLWVHCNCTDVLCMCALNTAVSTIDQQFGE